MKIEVTNEEEFLKALAKNDGEAKWLRTRGKIYVTDSMAETSSFPFDAVWGYAFSDELDCIDFDRIFAK
jgi:hypothetical protein